VANDSDFGERPELAMLASFPAFGSHTKAKQSPPRPALTGSTNPSIAFAATAASTAEPPRLSISMATWVARGCAVPAAPEQPRAGERDAKLAPAGPVAGVHVRANEALFPRCLKLGKRRAGGLAHCVVSRECDGASGSQGKSGKKSATAQGALLQTEMAITDVRGL
jgi:hypothetical protein